jgi:hypothetical protein
MIKDLGYLAAVYLGLVPLNSKPPFLYLKSECSSIVMETF